MTTVTVKSKTTGLVGNYPISHVDLDPDLEIVSPDEDVCVDCFIQPELETDVEELPPVPEPIEIPTRKGKNK